MSKISAKNAVILVGGYNLSTYFTNYEVTESHNPIDVTGFTDGCNNAIPGIYSGSITGNAIWDNTAGKSYPVLKELVGSTTGGSITILLEGTTAGQKTVSLPYTEGGITISGSPTTHISLGSINFSAYGAYEGVENGILLHHGAVTDSTTDAGVLFPQTDGAVTSKCAGTIHIWAACATDTYVVKIQDSADDASYNDLVTFTLDGSAVGSERVAVASGSVDKYVRVVAARTGAAGDSFGFSVHFWREQTVTT
ncbi:MAG: hypothetical protein KKD77_23890 [Gammaproteobacteria bacterium]|nr:hypothetical protein [Gammaproteobacteria bacterium]